MKCRKCGSEIEPGDQFCPRCGSSIIPQAPIQNVSARGGIDGRIIAALAAIFMVILGGGFYMYTSQKKTAMELEVAKIQEEARKEEAEKKEEEEKKAAEEAAKQEQASQQTTLVTNVPSASGPGTPYVVLSDVVNGVHLHTTPKKGETSNVRGTIFPGSVVNIVDIFSNSDCTWGKTSDGYYVCVYETWTDENKPVGQYLAPVN